MRPATPLPPPAVLLLRNVRDSRFAQRLECVHCGSPRVVRWGHARGRQRYRCGECSRTFSDLTATPFYYSKRIDAWPAYMECMEASLTLRRAAAKVGVHLSTSFRWRHALLRCAVDADPAVLGGSVELSSLRLPFSRKGERGLTCDRAHGLVTVICARDRFGSSYQGWRWHLAVHDYAQLLGERIAEDASVIGDRGPLAAEALFARRWTTSYTRGRSSPAIRQPLLADHTCLEHTGNVREEIRRLLVWMERFRGVATKYLPHYLRWHRYVDGSSSELATWRWALATNPLTNNSPEQTSTGPGGCGPPSPQGSVNPPAEGAVSHDATRG